MEQSLKFIFLIIILILDGCDRCGENVNLGDYELKPESITDWFPYLDIDKLTFVNQAGDLITLDKINSHNGMVANRFRTICDGGNWDDYAIEFYNGRSLGIQYEIVINGTKYFVGASLQVEHVENIADLKLYDCIQYSTYAINIPSTGDFVSGFIKMIATKHVNTITESEELDINDFCYEHSMQINGVAHSSVYYSKYGDSPSLFVQKGRGIIAFTGLDEEIWVLQK